VKNVTFYETEGVFIYFGKLSVVQVQINAVYIVHHDHSHWNSIEGLHSRMFCLLLLVFLSKLSETTVWSCETHQCCNPDAVQWRLRNVCEKLAGEKDLIITVPNICTQSCFVFTALLFTARKLKVFYSCSTTTASSRVVVASSNF
jgi:hypothetical protein